MNFQSSHKQPRSVISIITTSLIALLAISAVAACSPKPTAEESAAQTKVLVDQAVAEAKKEMIAEKDKQDAAAAAKTEEKAKQDAAVKDAVANERKRIAAEQRATNAKNERRAEQRASAAKSSNNSSSQSYENTSACSHCGVVLSVNEIESEGSGSGLGAVAGGVLGGVLGHQVGGGSGRDLATIAGAVGGAFAGNKVEKISKKARSYNIVVKMNTGEELTFNQATVPDVVRGDKITVENDRVIRR